MLTLNAKFTNFASATLQNPVSPADTSLVLTAGQGALFPTLAGGQYFYCVLQDTSTGNILEIVKVGGRTGDTLQNVDRGQDGTTAQSYSAGDKVLLRWVNAAINSVAGDIYNSVSAQQLGLVSVKSFGAVGNGIADDTTAIKAALAFAGPSQTVFFPDGVYKLTSTLTITAEKHLLGSSDAAVLYASTAFPCITIDSTANDVMQGSIDNLRFAGAGNTAGYQGISVIGATSTYVALWRFENLRFSGLHTGIAVTKGHGVSGSWNISLFTMNLVSNIIVDEYGAQTTEYGINADGANSLTVVGGLIRGRTAGIKIGNGSVGLGDILINGVHFNFGTAGSIELVGSTSPSTDYHAKIDVIGCQMDGANTYNVTASRISALRLIGNNFADGVFNNLSLVDHSVLDFNHFETRVGVQKTGVGIGATVDVFKVENMEISGYSTAYVEISIGSLVAGKGMAARTEGYNLIWAGGVLTISAAKYSYSDVTGTASATVVTSTAGNIAKFSISVNSTAIDSVVDVNARVVGSFQATTPL